MRYVDMLELSSPRNPKPAVPSQSGLYPILKLLFLLLLFPLLPKHKHLHLRRQIPRPRRPPSNRGIELLLRRRSRANNNLLLPPLQARHRLVHKLADGHPKRPALLGAHIIMELRLDRRRPQIDNRDSGPAQLLAQRDGEDGERGFGRAVRGQVGRGHEAQVAADEDERRGGGGGQMRGEFHGEVDEAGEVCVDFRVEG